MFRPWRPVLVAGASILTAASAAHASIIFDNGSPVGGDDLGFSDPDSGFIVADDFNLAAADMVRGIVVYGSYFRNDTLPAGDNFSVSFYNEVGGLPDGAGGPFASSALTVFSRVDTGLITAFGTRIFRYELNLATPQAFAAGTPFWASIINDTSGGVDPDDDWTWTDTLGRGNGTQSSNGGVTWPVGGGTFHFQLANAFFVPAPGTLALLGLAGLFGPRRRRR